MDAFAAVLCVFIVEFSIFIKTINLDVYKCQDSPASWTGKVSSFQENVSGFGTMYCMLLHPFLATEVRNKLHRR